MKLNENNSISNKKTVLLKNVNKVNKNKEVYKNSTDLLNKLELIKNNPKMLLLRSKNAKKKYFDIFSNNIVADFMIHKIFNNKNKYKHKWSN